LKSKENLPNLFEWGQNYAEAKILMGAG
jgi:hypothetical protein